MTSIYLVRHGESKGNKHYQETGQPIVGAGEMGTDLSDAGRKQVEETAEKLKDIQFQAIYSSDLVRAHESALIFAKNYNLQIETTPVLRERQKETETLENAAKRLKDLLQEISNKYTDHNILIVTHGALMRMFLISMKFVKTEEELPSGSIGNGGYVKLIFDGKEFKINGLYKVNLIK